MSGTELRPWWRLLLLILFFKIIYLFFIWIFKINLFLAFTGSSLHAVSLVAEGGVYS